VEEFVQSPPNESLMSVAAAALHSSARLLDIGCGAGRNAVPLAHTGWRVAGTDLSADSFDFIVAHGIWNLARSGREFRDAVREAARVARPGAPLFVFTFSRHTLPAAAEPIPGESFVYTQFSGQPQYFLTAAQLVAEMAAAGFAAEPSHPLRELNRPHGSLRAGGPVIDEGVFRCQRV
jgi:SAM-dependent methyltransferase